MAIQIFQWAYFKDPQSSTRLCDRRSLNKHLKNFHNIFPDVPTFCCFHCSENVRSLPTLHQFSHISQLQPALKLCNTCRVQTQHDYRKHFNNELDMPKWDMEENEIDLTRPRTNVITYSRDNPSAKMPEANFETPMRLQDILNFEDLDDNNWPFEGKKHLNFMKTSLSEIENFFFDNRPIKIA